MPRSVLAPRKEGDTYIFAAPVHEASVIPLMPLPNYGTVGAYIFQNPTECAGRFIDAGATPSTWPEIVATFTKTTGKPARFMSVTQEQWFAGVEQKGIKPDAKMPSSASPDDPATFTFRQTFGAWWNMWRDNTKEYEKKIRSRGHAAPEVEGKIRSLEEWMVRTDYQGEPKEPTKMRREMARN